MLQNKIRKAGNPKVKEGYSLQNTNFDTSGLSDSPKTVNGAFDYFQKLERNGQPKK
jgi:hypothetical protein